MLALSTISTLPTDHITTSNEQVHLRLGSAATLLPEPLAALVLDLAATRRPYTVIGQPDHSAWLFHGQRRAQHISADRLGQRLAALGIRPAEPDQPPSSPSPPNYPPRSSPACSASTSKSPPHGNKPPAQTGPPTPPT